MELRQITYISIAVRILAALLIGGILGLERERKNRAAGLRTYMLVCVGSCLIMLTNQYIYQTTGAGDPMRLGAQVVSGIGFLGAGTIIVTKRNRIKGLTTAAGLWSSAAVGLAIGVGFYEAAAAAGIAIYFIMTALRFWDVHMHRNSRYMELYLEYSKKASMGELMRQIRDLDVELENIEFERDDAADGNRFLFLTLKLPRNTDHKTVLNLTAQMDGVLYAKEL